MGKCATWLPTIESIFVTKSGKFLVGLTNGTWIADVEPRRVAWTITDAPVLPTRPRLPQASPPPLSFFSLH